MVIINHCPPEQLHAYPTVPLSPNLESTIQHDFAIGSFARFGNPVVNISIHDRPDFYNASHYTMRERLDREGFLEQFVIIDDRTAASHAVWYVETTETSDGYTAFAIEDHNPPVTHQGENHTVWQARILTQDLPIQWACLDVGVRSLIDDIYPYLFPYDPHNPQEEPFTIGVNFSRKEDAEGFWGDAYIEAEYEEINWSTDIHFRELISPMPPVVLELTEEAARGSGLLSAWRSAQRIPRPGETISTSAPYDWDSPKWSLNGTSLLKRRLPNLSLMAPTVNVPGTTCRSKSLLGRILNRFHTLSNTDGVNGHLHLHKANVSQT